MKRPRTKHQPSGSDANVHQPWQTSRPEVVARARRLVQDKNYPSKEILDSVAGLIVKKLKPSK